MYFAATHSFHKTKSAAMQAISVDAKMDVVISSLAIAGVLGVNFGYPQLDAYAALFIAIWIGFVGWQIGKNNIDKLLGNIPSEKKMLAIRRELEIFQHTKKILSYSNLRAHYVGSEIHLMVEVSTSAKSPREIHDLEEEIIAQLKTIGEVTNVGIHVDLV